MIVEPMILNFRITKNKLIKLKKYLLANDGFLILDIRKWSLPRCRDEAVS